MKGAAGEKVIKATSENSVFGDHACQCIVHLSGQAGVGVLGGDPGDQSVDRRILRNHCGVARVWEGRRRVVDVGDGDLDDGGGGPLVGTPGLVTNSILFR